MEKSLQYPDLFQMNESNFHVYFFWLLTPVLLEPDMHQGLLLFKSKCASLSLNLFVLAPNTNSLLSFIVWASVCAVHPSKQDFNLLCSCKCRPSLHFECTSLSVGTLKQTFRMLMNHGEVEQKTYQNESPSCFCKQDDGHPPVINVVTNSS